MVISIKDSKINCKVVSTPEKIRQGMMGKTFDDFEGMIFIMPENEIQSFWMKNCIIPLDIIFIDGNTIEDISPNCPPCDSMECPSYQGKGGMVLEVPAGFCKKTGIKIGDTIDFNF